MNRIVERMYLYPTCKVVSGYSRSVIQDLNKGKYYFIPTLLCHQLDNLSEKSYIATKPRLVKEGNDLNKYLDFLIENDLIYVSESAIPFKNIELEYNYPHTISNVIVCYKKSKDSNIFDKIIKELSILDGNSIQFFFEDFCSIPELTDMLQITESSYIDNIDIIMPYNTTLKEEEINELLCKSNSINRILIYDSPYAKINRIHESSIKVYIYTDSKISYLDDCGSMHPLFFTNNLPFFSEAQTYNTCLNRKLCIDAEGNIKNCPTMTRSFGNIKDKSLQEVIEISGFKDLWTINKDSIDVCKDCEFRYMCMDCRCFLKDTENIHSQPAKCPYNPYICKWDGQEGYLSVEECGVYTKETGFIPDIEKIEQLNKQIWGEDD